MEENWETAEWYTSEFDRLEKSITTEQDKIKDDDKQMSLLADDAINELDSAFRAAAENRQRKKDAFMKSIAASTPSET